MSNHESIWNEYMDLGYSIADAFAAATADVERLARITRLTFADHGIFGN